MLRTEIKQLIKQTVFFAAVVFVLAIASQLAEGGTFGSVFLPVVQAGLLFFSFFTGLTLFETERRQGGMEYLLSLPYTRHQLLGIKVLPRLAAAVLFFLVYLAVTSAVGSDFSAFGSYSFPVLYFALFFLALSFSGSSSNFLVLASASFGASAAFVLLLFLANVAAVYAKAGYPLFGKFFYMFTAQIDGLYSPTMNMLSAFVLVVPFLLAFWFAFKGFDVKTSGAYNKTFFKRLLPFMVPAMLLCFLFAYKGIEPPYKQYILTQDHNVLVRNFDGTFQLHQKDGMKEIPVPYYTFLLEKLDDFIYGRQYTKDYRYIIRVNIDTLEHEKIFKTDRTLPYFIRRYGDTLAWVDGDRQNIKDRRLVLLNQKTKKQKVFDLSAYSWGKNLLYYSVFGAGELEGGTFWLVSTSFKQKNWKVLMVSEADGGIRELGGSYGKPVYVNNMLISWNKGTLTARRITPEGMEIVREIPSDTIISFSSMFSRTDLNPVRFKEIYGGLPGFDDKNPVFCLNLETLELKEVKNASGYIRYYPPGGFYTMAWDHSNDGLRDALKAAYRLENGEAVLLRKFDGSRVTNEGNSRVRFSQGGIIWTSPGGAKFYAFPDLKEIKFAEL